MISCIKPRVALYYVLTVAVIGLFCLCIWLFPFADDDYAFMSEYGLRSFNPQGKGVNLWAGFLDFLNIKYKFDNCRLGNYIASTTLLTPVWVPHIIEMLSFCYMFHAMTRLSGLRPGNCAGLTVMTFLLVIGLPWQDSMFSVMYAFNYIVSSAIFCFVILFLVNGKGKAPAFLALGLLMGVWHESFGVALGSGIVLWCMIDRREGWQKRLWMLGGLIAGTLILVSAPGPWSRLSSTTPWSPANFARCIYILSGVAGALTVMVALCSDRWRRWMATQPIVLLFAGSTVLLLLVPVTGMERSAFPCALLGCASLTRFARKAVANGYPRRTAAVAATAVWIFLLAHLTTLAAYSARLQHLQHQILSALAQPPQGPFTVIFANTAYLWEDSWLTLRRPDYLFLYPQQRNLIAIEQYAETIPLIVPESLRKFNPQQATPLESNIPAWITSDGYVVIDRGEYDRYELAEVNYRLRSEATPIYRTPFYNEQGQRWVYVAITRSLISAYMTDIKSIYFNE